MGLLGAALRWIRRAVYAALLVWAGLILCYAAIPPVSTLMLARWASGESASRDYIGLEQIAPSLPLAVIASEDQRFCDHGGVDWTELRAVIEEADEDGPARGASTLTMQSVKNTLLWPSRSAIRKGLEIPLAMASDLVWGKRRTMEIYLNVAEWGEGLYGAQAAARHHFGKDAARLTARESALLVAALPNPVLRNAGKPSAALQRRAAAIQRRVAQMGEQGADCVLK